MRFCKRTTGGNELVRIATEPLTFLLIDSMLPKNTGRMIEKVKGLKGVLPETVECVFDGIEGLVMNVTNGSVNVGRGEDVSARGEEDVNARREDNRNEGREDTHKGEITLNPSHLNHAIDMNQYLLQALGVSCEAIDAIVGIARQHHYAAKLTGGGGGGCVIAVASTEADEKDEEAFMTHLSQRGFDYQRIQIGGKGVQVEEE